ncbi:GNAT family N-acetyltransferase [Luteimonas suaedae]|uniref:GNAT family N-acetyltransferase n=1 Tax=Luteimonas suaedae TaxID=2605430 RepID=UPI0011ED26E4|nr:GNAT family N-acetyltransferase [Luteimonas suaedae]
MTEKRSPLPTLQGPRIRLRPHREDDLAAFFALYSDPEAMRYWSFPAWTDIAQARDRFAAALLSPGVDGTHAWAVAGADDALIGGLTLFSIDGAQRRAEIGYALQSAHWGRGYAQEAMRLAIEYAFDALRLRRIEADIDPRNQGSCRLVERIGFVREGLLRQRWLVAGEITDTALYGLLQEDWHRRAQQT